MTYQPDQDHTERKQEKRAMQAITPEVVTTYEDMSLADIAEAFRLKSIETERQRQADREKFLAKREARRQKHEATMASLAQIFGDLDALTSGDTAKAEAVCQRVEAEAAQPVTLAPTSRHRGRPAKRANVGPTVKQLRAMLKEAGVKGIYQRNKKRLIKSDLLAIATDAGLL